MKAQSLVLRECLVRCHRAFSFACGSATAVAELSYSKRLAGVFCRFFACGETDSFLWRVSTTKQECGLIEWGSGVGAGGIG